MTKQEAKQLLAKVVDQNKGTDFGKGAELGLWLFEMITEPEQADPCKAPEVKKTEKPKKPEASKEKRVYNYKPKKCKVCGKEFIPTYGSQNTCQDCKDMAKALASMEG